MVDYVDGEPIHNDVVLMPDEQEKSVALCVAGCKSKTGRGLVVCRIISSIIFVRPFIDIRKKLSNAVSNSSGFSTMLNERHFQL